MGECASVAGCVCLLHPSCSKVEVVSWCNQGMDGLCMYALYYVVPFYITRQENAMSDVGPIP